MSADKDRAVRRQKQKRAKDRKRALKKGYDAGTTPAAAGKPADAAAAPAAA